MLTKSEKIVSVEYLGEKELWDIEIDSPDHIYYANGIANSNSHSIGYAHITYWTAYLKTYYPEKFYLNWLRQAKDKIDPDKEMRELITSAKSDGIKVCGPSISLLNENFCSENGVIYFGFCNVKNVGLAEFKKIQQGLKDVDRSDWTKLLIQNLLGFNKRTVENLIYCGTFDQYGKSRLEMIHEFSCLRDLTDKELDWLKVNYNDVLTLEQNLHALSPVKKNGGGAANINRTKEILEIADRLQNAGRDLWNNPSVLSKIERELMGCELSFSELDGCKDASFANCTCQQFAERNHGKQVMIAATIKTYREYETKSGEMMCFLTVEDKTGEMENVIVFPNIYSEFSDIVYDDSTVIITGERSKTGEGLIVERIDQI